MLSQTSRVAQLEFVRIRSKVLRSVFALVRMWRRRARTRRHLAHLDATGLKDVGVGELERRIECAKPFWRP